MKKPLWPPREAGCKVLVLHHDHVTATALLNLLGLGSCDDMKYLREVSF
jgi:hypothetical protein